MCLLFCFSLELGGQLWPCALCQSEYLISQMCVCVSACARMRACVRPSCVFCSPLVWSCHWAVGDSRQMGKEGGVCREHVNSTSQQIPIRCSGALYSGETVLSWRGKKTQPWQSTQQKIQPVYSPECSDQILYTCTVCRSRWDGLHFTACRNRNVAQMLYFILCFQFTFDSPFWDAVTAAKQNKCIFMLGHKPREDYNYSHPSCLTSENQLYPTAGRFKC